MISIIAAILLIAAGLSEAAFDCNLSQLANCRSDILRKSFPETEEEFNKACDAIKELLECSINYERECQNNAGDLDMGLGYQEVANKVCDQDLDIYPVVVSNLECIKTLIDSNACPMNPQAALNTASRSDLQVVKEASSSCIANTYTFACISAKLGTECNGSVKDTSIEIFQDMIKVINTCKPEIVNAFPLIVDTIVLEETEAEELEETLERKK